MAKAKEIHGLDYEADASSGVRLVLQARLKEMCDLRQSALDWSSIDGVHDMRVASRRLRSAMRDFKPCLRGKGIEQARLKKVARALGDVRDDDVGIAALESLKAEAPKAVAAGFDALLDERRWRRNHARDLLEKAVSETALASLQERFNAQLERVTQHSSRRKTGRGGHDFAAMPFREFGREVILARVKDLLSGGESLYQPLKAGPLHRLRIKAKNLRYAIELFAKGFGAQLNPFAEEMAELQTSLGELHDCDVWVKDMGERLTNHVEDGAAEGLSHGDAGSVARSASCWLLQHFTEERTKHYLEALARWHEWETSGFHSRLEGALEKTQRASRPLPFPRPAAKAPPASIRRKRR